MAAHRIKTNLSPTAHPYSQHTLNYNFHDHSNDNNEYIIRKENCAFCLTLRDKEL